MVDPKGYPRNKHASWKPFLWCFMGPLAHKSTDTTDLFRGSSLPTSPTPLRRIECRLNLLPPEQPRVVIPYSQWRRRDDNGTRVSSIENRVGSSLRPQERSKPFCEACLSHRAKPRHQSDIQRWEAGGPGYRN